MLVKALVLGREDGLFHQSRNFLDAYHRTAFFAELPDQHAVGRIDAQGIFGWYSVSASMEGRLGYARRMTNRPAPRPALPARPTPTPGRRTIEATFRDIRKKVAHYR